MTADHYQYLGLDVGTQGTKGVVIDNQSRQVVATASNSYGTIPDLPAGASEQDPQTWIKAVSEGVAYLRRNPAVHPERMSAISVSGQQHGLVVLDQHDQVVRPAKLWNDTATVAEADEVSRFVGYQVPISYTVNRILWLKRHEPANWAKTTAIMLPHDYVNFYLTGIKSMEAGDASGTGLLDSSARAWDQRLIDWLDPRVADMLPELVLPGSPAGLLSDQGADLLGLPQGILVASGAGDNMASAIGGGASTPGPVILSIGTSGTAFAYSNDPVIDPEGAVCAFCDSTGGWLPLVAVLSMTEVTEAVKGMFVGETHTSLTTKASEVAPGADGLLFLPFLGGERTPSLPMVHGTLDGITYSNLTPGHLYRAAIEGTTLNLAMGLDRMRRAGLKADSLRVVGGGANNPLWLQTVADTTGLPTYTLHESESAAMGAAIQAQWTCQLARGDRTPISRVAEPYVRVSHQPVMPQQQSVDLYHQMRLRMSDRIEELHG